MAPNRKSGPGQGELIITAEQTGQMATPDFYADPETAAISLNERYIHIQNTITYLAAVSMRAGFIQADNNAIANGWRHAAPGMRKGVEEARAKFAKAAEDSFIKASGNETLLAAGLITEPEFKILNRQMFSDFMKKYYGANKYKEAQAYRRELAAKNTTLQTFAQTKKNRTEGKRPHAPEAQVPIERETESSENIKPLATPFRMKAILEDPRAGFLPTTNREKNQVIAFLDYLDNPEYPFGVNNQFLEVFSHTQKIRRKKPEVDSKRGTVSITYEFGDYLANASGQLDALQALEPLLLELPNNRVVLAEEREWIDLNHPGWTALIRYRDLLNFMNKGTIPEVKDPLRTKEDRWTRSGAGQHKIVEDRYTARLMSEAFSKYVTKSIENMTVGKARNLIDSAIEDQIRRQAFMRLRLEEIAMPTEQMQGAAREVLRDACDTAIQILGEFQLA